MTHSETSFTSASELSSAVMVVGNKTYRAIGQYEGAVVELALDNASLKIAAHEHRQDFLAKGQKSIKQYDVLKRMGTAPAAKAAQLQGMGMSRVQGLNNRTSLRTAMSVAPTAARTTTPAAKPAPVKAPAAPTMTMASSQVNKQKKQTLAGRMETLGAMLGYIPGLSPSFA